LVDYAEIHRMAQNDDVNKRKEAVDQIGTNFQNFSKKDKEQAWNDLLALTKEEHIDVRWHAADALSPAFQYMTDKEQAWNDLMALTKDEDRDVRGGAAYALGPAFQHMTDKEQASKDLLTLTKDENSSVRMGAANALGSAFQHMTDKEQASKDLLALTKDEDSEVRMEAAFALGTAVQYVTDKEQAIKELLELTKDEDSMVRGGAAIALGFTFQYVTDKEQATKELLELIKDEDSEVRRGAVGAIASAFQYITDKEQAWKNLLELTKDEDSEVRMDAAYALGPAFQYVSDKEQTIKELLKLAKDGVSVVSVSANYSLGKISIYKATEAESEDELKEEMAKAIGYFEKSSQESKFCFNPAKFCLPFYRSYNAVIFRQENAKEEIERNLEEAKRAVEGSESKDKLIEIVENLANALQEAQKSKVFDKIQADLGKCLHYCNRAEELLKSTEENAPIVTELIKKGLPIIDEKIQKIQEKARAIFEQTKNTGTPFESLGVEANKFAYELTSKNPFKTKKSVKRIAHTLDEFCEYLPKNKRSYGCDIVKSIAEEEDLQEQLNIIDIALTYIQPNIKPEQPSPIRKIVEILSISFTIAGVIWGIIYAILSEMSYATAMRESLIIFTFTFLLILFVSAMKR